MDSAKLEQNLSRNAHTLQSELVADLKQEFTHIADPSQCGVVVRRHFTGLVVTLYLFIFLFLLATTAAIYLFLNR